MSYKGKFTPTNKDKYDGDWTSITYRSLWERKVMVYLDRSDNVLKWSSEEVVIPYIGEDGKRHRYFPDFLAEIRQANGKVETMLIEVKPYKETQPPKSEGRVRNRGMMLREMIYIKNRLKWEAAQKVCEERGWRFQILTEHELKPDQPNRRGKSSK